MSTKSTVVTVACGVACGVALHTIIKRYYSSTPKASTSTSGRCAHWVTRCSDLKTQLTFLEEVLGMRVIRHEENAEPCGITCNGRYNNAWSKTMVGYDTEDKSYCLEVTYNYGVDSYPPGTGLMNFAIAVSDVAATINKAGQLGYKVTNSADHQPGASIIGPDGYRYHLVDQTAVPYFAARTEKFLHVTQRVADLEASLKLYTETLRMQNVTSEYPVQPMKTGAKYAVLSGSGIEQPALLLVQDGVKPVIESFEGRHAISMPEMRLRQVYAKLQAEAKDLIVHDLQVLHEVLGVLCIFIMKDVDGMELCIVSSETFDKAVLAAADWKAPDFEFRRKFLDERALKARSFDLHL